MLMLLVKALALVENLLEHWVVPNILIVSDGNNEWFGYAYANMTFKGERLIGSISTLIDNGLIMLAQLSVMFPIANGVAYTGMPAATI